jgi:large subunit ribosomal protein L5
MNKMKEIRIEKITLNMGVGESGEKIKKAIKLLSTISGSNPISTKSYKRIPKWKVRPGLEIGVKVTVRGKKAVELLKRLFSAVENKINPKSFDQKGHFSFGIPEYLEIPEMKYDVDIGIVGLEVAVTLERAGYRIKKRKFKKSKIGKSHIITREEAMTYIREEFNIQLGGTEDDN